MIGLLLSPAGRVIAGVVLAAALLGGVWAHGHATGHTAGRDRAEARHAAAVRALEAELRTVTRAARIAELARLQLERERDDLRADLDAQGDAAPGAGRVSLPADSVRRIDAIGRQARPAAPLAE